MIYHNLLIEIFELYQLNPIILNLSNNNNLTFKG